MDPLRPIVLTCEHLENPLGLDERSPRLYWILEGDGRGRRQSAFEIRVAEDPVSLAGTDRLSWCSGRVASAETRDIAYAGAPLQPRTRYHWTVLVGTRPAAHRPRPPPPGSRPGCLTSLGEPTG